MPIDIPNCRFERRLGRGAAGEVWLATHLMNGRQAAIKLLDPADSSLGDFGELFLREAQTLAGFDHPNIVRIYDNGIIGDIAFIAMEYLPGGTLLERMTSKPATVGEAIAIVVQVAGALAAAHRVGVIHRDLKPANIIFRDDATPVLSDFGAARLDGRQTIYGKQGCIVGTPAYMSPEQICGKSLSGSSDLYALGLILYELLSGTRPHSGQSTTEILAQRLHAPMPELPHSLTMLQPVLERLLAREPEDRYQRGEEVIDALLNTFVSSEALRLQTGFGSTDRAWSSQLRALAFPLDATQMLSVRKAQGAAIATLTASADTEILSVPTIDPPSKPLKISLPAAPEKLRVSLPAAFSAVIVAWVLAAVAWAWQGRPSQAERDAASGDTHAELARVAPPSAERDFDQGFQHLQHFSEMNKRLADLERKLERVSGASSMASPTLTRLRADLQTAENNVGSGHIDAQLATAAQLEARLKQAEQSADRWVFEALLLQADAALARRDPESAEQAIDSASVTGLHDPSLDRLRQRVANLRASTGHRQPAPAPIDQGDERRLYRPDS